MSDVGVVAALYRYPVKSMAGVAIAHAELGWHGVEGDRRFAAVRVGERGGMPWLTASRLPDLLRFVPFADDGGARPTHVRDPEGRTFALDDELAAELSRRHGREVAVLRLDHGVFDETPVSVIAQVTIDAIARACDHAADARRYRPNIVLACEGDAFVEDAWVGGVLTFGDGDGPAVHVVMRDERCAMINLDPDRATGDPRVMKWVVQTHGNTAGVYASVIRPGTLAVGQRVRWRPA